MCFTGFLTVFSVVFSDFSTGRLSSACSHVPKQPENATGRQKPQEQHWLVSQRRVFAIFSLLSNSDQGVHKRAAVSSAMGIHGDALKKTFY